MALQLVVISSHNLLVPCSTSGAPAPQEGLRHAYLLASSSCPSKQMTRLTQILAGHHSSGCHLGLIGKEVIVVIRSTSWRRRGWKCKWLWLLNCVTQRLAPTMQGLGCPLVLRLDKETFFSTCRGWLLLERPTFTASSFCAFRSSLFVSSLHPFT